MRIGSTLQLLSDSNRPDDFSHFAQDIDPAWVEEALRATGTATVRRRRMPAVQVVWLVIGMALFRNRAIREIVDKLDLALPGTRGTTVAPSAIPQARDRVGDAPLEWLFLRTAEAWAHASADRDRWRGLALYGLDGTTQRVPDSDENRAFFGLANGAGRGLSGFPLVRLVGLLALRSHLVAAASFGPYTSGEYTYATDLWPLVPPNSLTVVDRNFWAANVLIPLARDGQNRHWLIRAKSITRGRRVKLLGRGDELVELRVTTTARRQNPTLPTTWVVRVVRYQRKGFRPQRLITSLLDADTYPADEIVALYHERWELELAYDEIKTEMLETSPLRSQTPVRVRQEVWGLLIAYNLVRLEMERVADEAMVRPTRISFVMVYRMITDEWLWSANAAPGAIPQHLRDLRDQVARFVLPERRTGRSYPRAVKVKMSNYAKKRRPTDRRQPPERK